MSSVPHHQENSVRIQNITYWNSGSSESKSTHSTPTRSSCSSTIDARSWSIESSMPRKCAFGDLEGIRWRFCWRWVEEGQLCNSSNFVIFPCVTFWFRFSRRSSSGMSINQERLNLSLATWSYVSHRRFIEREYFGWNKSVEHVWTHWNTPASSDSALKIKNASSFVIC